MTICCRKMWCLRSTAQALFPGTAETHQGIYDPAFLSQIQYPLYAPSNYQELTLLAAAAAERPLPWPRAIRYPRGGQDAVLAGFGCSGQEYDYLYKNENATIVLVSYADELTDVLQAAQELKQKDIVCDVLKLVKLYPFNRKSSR